MSRSKPTGSSSSSSPSTTTEKFTNDKKVHDLFMKVTTFPYKGKEEDKKLDNNNHHALSILPSTQKGDIYRERVILTGSVALIRTAIEYARFNPAWNIVIEPAVMERDLAEWKGNNPGEPAPDWATGPGTHVIVITYTDVADEEAVARCIQRICHAWYKMVAALLLLRPSTNPDDRSISVPVSLAPVVPGQEEKKSNKNKKKKEKQKEKKKKQQQNEQSYEEIMEEVDFPYEANEGDYNIERDIFILLPSTHRGNTYRERVIVSSSRELIEAAIRYAQPKPEWKITVEDTKIKDHADEWIQHHGTPPEWVNDSIANLIVVLSNGVDQKMPVYLFLKRMAHVWKSITEQINTDNEEEEEGKGKKKTTSKSGEDADEKVMSQTAFSYDGKEEDQKEDHTIVHAFIALPSEPNRQSVMLTGSVALLRAVVGYAQPHSAWKVAIKLSSTSTHQNEWLRKRPGTTPPPWTGIDMRNMIVIEYADSNHTMLVSRFISRVRRVWGSIVTSLPGPVINRVVAPLSTAVPFARVVRNGGVALLSGIRVESLVPAPYNSLLVHVATPSPHLWPNPSEFRDALCLWSDVKTNRLTRIRTDRTTGPCDFTIECVDIVPESKWNEVLQQQVNIICDTWRVIRTYSKSEYGSRLAAAMFPLEWEERSKPTYTTLIDGAVVIKLKPPSHEQWPIRKRYWRTVFEDVRRDPRFHLTRDADHDGEFFLRCTDLVPIQDREGVLGEAFHAIHKRNNDLRTITEETYINREAQTDEVD